MAITSAVDHLQWVCRLISSIFSLGFLNNLSSLLGFLINITTCSCGLGLFLLWVSLGRRCLFPFAAPLFLPLVLLRFVVPIVFIAVILLGELFHNVILGQLLFLLLIFFLLLVPSCVCVHKSSCLFLFALGTVGSSS
jgi:hypothetical protein